MNDLRDHFSGSLLMNVSLFKYRILPDPQGMSYFKYNLKNLWTSMSFTLKYEALLQDATTYWSILTIAVLKQKEV